MSWREEPRQRARALESRAAGRLERVDGGRLLAMLLTLLKLLGYLAAMVLGLYVLAFLAFMLAAVS